MYMLSDEEKQMFEKRKNDLSYYNRWRQQKSISSQDLFYIMVDYLKLKDRLFTTHKTKEFRRFHVKGTRFNIYSDCPLSTASTSRQFSSWSGFRWADSAA